MESKQEIGCNCVSWEGVAGDKVSNIKLSIPGPLEVMRRSSDLRRVGTGEGQDWKKEDLLEVP